MIIDLAEFKKSKEPHRTGPAKCVSCQHTWIAVAPVGILWLECHSCGSETGRFEGACVPTEDVFHCGCGNELFYVTADGFSCPACGEAWRK